MEQIKKKQNEKQNVLQNETKDLTFKPSKSLISPSLSFFKLFPNIYDILL